MKSLLFFSSLLIATTLLTGCQTTTEPLTPLDKAQSDHICQRCNGYVLPGNHIPSPRTTYRIDSDLPEIYLSNGVLYTTRDVLPAFTTLQGELVPEQLRRQTNNGFQSIDDDFEVFLYHLIRYSGDRDLRRIVVHVRNNGDVPVTIAPRQVMEHGPLAGNPTSVESVLTERVLFEDWNIVMQPVTVTPGESAIVGWTKQLGATQNNADQTKATFVTGILRADVKGTGDVKPKLEVSVISIPGQDKKDNMLALAEKYYTVGAKSGEDNMDLMIAPPECHVRRVGGVSPNVMWAGNGRFDVATLPQDDIYFQMASFAVQTVGCEEIRQSADMLLHPGYVRRDTVGNYMMEYQVNLTLTNSADGPHDVDIRFGKKDAPVGLAWQMAIGEEPVPLEMLETLPVEIDWAGKGRLDNGPFYTNSMLSQGPVTIPAKGEKTISMRLMVIGTSALPYQLHIVPQ